WKQDNRPCLEPSIAIVHQQSHPRSPHCTGERVKISRIFGKITNSHPVLSYQKDLHTGDKLFSSCPSASAPGRATRRARCSLCFSRLEAAYDACASCLLGVVGLVGIVHADEREPTGWR